MATHTQHPDSHLEGLADNCPRCKEHALDPFHALDDENLAILARRVRLGEDPRSANEEIAMMNIHTVINNYLRLGWAEAEAKHAR